MAKLAEQINKKIKTRFMGAGLLFLFLWIGPNGFCTVVTRENHVVKAVRKVSPAVVNISSQYEIRKNTNPFFGYGMDPMVEGFFRDFFSPELERREKRTSLGSGVIIDGDRGFVLTNTHVIEKATSISVTLNDKRELEATIVGMDPDSDLAVLKIESQQPLPAIEMGNSNDIMIGESVIAIGNPFGFSHTVTTGVVSAINRSIKTGDRIFHEFIQTDASINPGNSGGPLLNTDGELIGINTAIYAQAQGIGFAIPINRAKRIISDLINYGEVVQAWVGLTIQSIDPGLAEYLNIKKETGLMVHSVEPESPASAAGFQEGDIILSLDGSSMTDPSNYQKKLKELAVGQTIAIDIFRQKKKKRISLKTALFPIEKADKLAEDRLGIAVSPLDPKTRSRYGIHARKGALIIEMQRNSYLDRIGVQPGDVIRQMDEARIDNTDDFKAAIIKYRNKQSVVLLIQRGRHLYHINAIMKDIR